MTFGFRRLCVLSCIVLGSSLSSSADTLEERLAACQTVSDSLERLACFENIANESAEQPSLESTAPQRSTAAPTELAPSAIVEAPAPVASVAPAPSTEQQASSLPAREKPVARPKPVKVAKDEPKRYEGLVKKAQYDATGKLLVQLTNGEIWKQTSRGRFRLPPAGSGVRVRKSFSGAWFLKFDHDGRESKMTLKRYSD